MNIVKRLLASLVLTASLIGCSNSSVSPAPSSTFLDTRQSGVLLKGQTTLAEEATVIAVMDALRVAGWVSTAVIGVAAAQVFLINIQNQLTAWYSDALIDGSGDEYFIERVLNQQDIRGIADLYVDIQSVPDAISIQNALNNPAEFIRRLREDIVPRYLAGEHSSNPNSSSCCSDIANSSDDVPAPPSTTFPGDPAQPPVPGYTEWSGQPPTGGDKGAWKNPQTGESLHPDLDHPAPVGPHWDWNTIRGKYRWFPDGRLEKAN